jgi:two-component system nitrogen regulation response regulator GlnG
MAPAQTIEIKDLPPDLVSTQQAGAEFATSAGSLPIDGTVGNGGVTNGVAPITGAPVAAGGVVIPSPVAAWESGLRTEVAKLLRENAADVMDELSRRFEAAVIREALDFTRGRKVEAAERLGIGRNTITRKIQELNLEP